MEYIRQNTYSKNGSVSLDVLCQIVLYSGPGKGPAPLPVAPPVTNLINFNSIMSYLNFIAICVHAEFCYSRALYIQGWKCRGILYSTLLYSTLDNL